MASSSRLAKFPQSATSFPNDVVWSNIFDPCIEPISDFHTPKESEESKKDHWPNSIIPKSGLEQDQSGHRKWDFQPAKLRETILCKIRVNMGTGMCRFNLVATMSVDSTMRAKRSAII